MRNATLHGRARACGLVIGLLLVGACNPYRQRNVYPKRTVTAKEGISVLIANNARCLVPTKQFPAIKVGQEYSCNWRETITVPASTTTRAAGGR